MKFPLSWLYDYVDIKGVTPKEFRDKMTMSGTMIESIEEVGAGIENVVLGRILSVAPHSNADKLVICQVDVGEGLAPPAVGADDSAALTSKPNIIQIVTGAPNVLPNSLVPVALDGAHLPGGKIIKTGELRGVLSQGMMCGQDELIPNAPKSETLWFLDKSLTEKFPLGTDIKEVLGLNETIVEVELTANRPDCFSIIGIAREAAAVWEKELQYPERCFPSSRASELASAIAADLHSVRDTVESIPTVTIAAPALCPRYSACAVQNVRLAPSPEWLQKRLNNSGIRSINNIVDITNYIMLEYGQPLHAFDARLIRGNEIIVRKAKNGEKIVTLDEQERILIEDDLIIADKEGPIAIAGVMGGLGSGIVADTTSVIFESANFNGASVRRTSKRLNLPSEASGHFIKGIDENITLAALTRACELVKELSAGDVVDGFIDVHNELKTPWQVEFSAEKINTFLGTQISENEMINILNKVNISVVGADIIRPHIEGNTPVVGNDAHIDPSSKSNIHLTATIPTYRADVTTWEDLSEEIARFYGYNNIPSAPLRGIADGGLNKEQILENKAKELLAAQGVDEILTYSFISPKDYEKAEIPLDNPIIIQNPLGEDTSIMRTQPITSMLTALHNNARLGNSSALLFELATVYEHVVGDDGNRPANTIPASERKILTIGAYGSYDFYDIKGIIENLFDGLGVKPAVIKSLQKIPPYLHDFQSAEIVIRGKTQGKIGRIHPHIAKNYEIKGNAFLAEIEWDSILASANLDKTYKEIPKFPGIQRDIALIADINLPVLEIENAIKSVKNNILESIKLFDIYIGEQVPEGKKSVAYSLIFRAQDKTLTEQEVNSIMGEILAKLSDKLHLTLRA